MIGKTVSHYKTIRDLVSGGMGVVYEAVDTRLDRTVALEFLPPDSTRDPHRWWQNRQIQVSEAELRLG